MDTLLFVIVFVTWRKSRIFFSCLYILMKLSGCAWTSCCSGSSCNFDRGEEKLKRHKWKESEHICVDYGWACFAEDSEMLLIVLLGLQVAKSETGQRKRKHSVDPAVCSLSPLPPLSVLLSLTHSPPSPPLPDSQISSVQTEKRGRTWGLVGVQTGVWLLQQPAGWSATGFTSCSQLLCLTHTHTHTHICVLLCLWGLSSP